MSSNGQIIGGVVGAVVGVFLPGSAAVIGQSALVGASIGAALDPPPGPDIKGPRIDDNAEQTSSYGAGVSTINGEIGVKGTWIWIENNKKKIVAKKEDSGGGKGGGGGSETTTYEAFVTGCILLTDHPVDGLERLWFTSDLVVNGLSADLSTAAASGELFPTLHLHTDSGLLKAALNTTPEAGTVRLYPGYDDQPVDPRMEADLGAGNCPAYRGYTLLFLYDYPLKDYSNSIAGLQVKAELIRGGATNTPTLLKSNHYESVEGGGGLSPTANYLWPDEAIVLTPRWPPYFAAPVSSSVVRLNYGMDGVTRDGGYAISGPGPGPYEDGDGPGYIQRGITDDPDFYTTGAFAGTLGLIGNFVGFTDAGGRFAAKGDEYAGTIWAPARGIYRWSGKNVSAAITYDPGISTVDVTLDDSLYTYALLSSGIIKKYDSSLTEVDTKTLTFEADSGVDYSQADNFIHWDSGVVYFIFGRQARYIHAMPDDFSGNPSYLCDVGVSPHGETATSELLAITAATVKDGILTRFTVAQADQDTAVDRWLLPTVGGSGQSLASVTRERLERSELIEPADIDVSLLTGNVSYATSGISSVRSTVSPLMSAYNFDIQPHGYQLKCIPRGQSSVMTIDYDDLDARSFGSAPGIAVDHQREMDAQLPKQLLVDYIDAGRNYNRNQESSIERIGSTSVNKESYEVPFVFTPNEAAEIASTQMDRRWLERDDFAFVLPQTYNRLEAADVVDIVTPYATYEWRLTSVNLLADGRVECTAKLNDSAIYTQNATGGTRVEGDTTISFAGKSIMHLLDIPLIRDEDNKPGFAGSLCGKSSGWPGGTIIRSVDSGQTFQAIQGFIGGVTSGVCRDPLPAHDGYVIDRDNTLTIDLYNSGMSLSSITEAQMLTGKHWAAYGVAGRWELIQFANATLNADDSYTIDTLVRGAKGTEQYTDDHVDGDIFILLADADAAFIAANVSDIGVERIYRGVTTGKDIDTVADTDFTYSGVNLKPLSPVQLAGSIDGSNNWDLTWVRRSRLSSSEWATGVDIPTGEDSESYEIDIMDGADVARTLTSTSEAVEYSSADQVSDFGGNQTTLTFRIYQMSATVGRGYVAEITL